MQRPDIRVGVAPMGRVPDIAAEVVAAQFIGTFNIAADILPPLEHPQYAFDERRAQYNAGLILKALESSESDVLFRECDKVIAVMDADLFVPIFTHVFGEARQGGKFALVSLFRLDRNLERAAKIALHEFGHLCSLPHCADENCLMHFSKGLPELDRLPPYFCRYCSVFLKGAIFGEDV